MAAFACIPARRSSHASCHAFSAHCMCACALHVWLPAAAAAAATTACNPAQLSSCASCHAVSVHCMCACALYVWPPAARACVSATGTRATSAQLPIPGLQPASVADPSCTATPHSPCRQDLSLPPSGVRGGICLRLGSSLGTSCASTQTSVRTSAASAAPATIG